MRKIKFRCAITGNNKSVIVEPLTISNLGYTVNTQEILTKYIKKYPNDAKQDFDKFLQDFLCRYKIEKLQFNVISILGFNDLMQATGIYDATKFKNLSPEEQNQWLKKNTKESWPGFEIYEGDVTALRYDKNRTEYEVVSYSTFGAGYSKSGTALSSYKKLTTVVGNIYEGYPEEAKYAVNFYKENLKEESNE